MTPDFDWQAIHRDALVIDSHNDTIVGLMRRDGQSMAGPDAPSRAEPESLIAYLRGPVDTAEIPIQSDLPAMREGGLDVGYFAIDNTRAWGNHLAYVLDGFGWFHAELQAHSPTRSPSPSPPTTSRPPRPPARSPPSLPSRTQRPSNAASTSSPCSTGSASAP